MGQPLFVVMVNVCCCSRDEDRLVESLAPPPESERLKDTKLLLIFWLIGKGKGGEELGELSEETKWRGR